MAEVSGFSFVSAAWTMIGRLTVSSNSFIVVNYKLMFLTIEI